jgi:hypothetical protein
MPNETATSTQVAGVMSRWALAAFAAALAPVYGGLLFAVSGGSSLVGGLVGRVLVLGPPSAIFLGIIALKEIRRSGGEMRGRGFAIAGLVLGILITVAATVLVVGFILAFRSFQF